MIKTFSYFLLATVVYAASALGQEKPEQAPSLYSFQSLSVEAASQTAWAAIKECRKRGYSVAVAVVDRDRKSVV